MMKMNNVSVSGRKRREEKVMTEAATMGRSVTALPTQEASHHSRRYFWCNSSIAPVYRVRTGCGGCDTQ